nr:hypothetical protein [Staphylococcus aureus]
MLMQITSDLKHFLVFLDIVESKIETKRTAKSFKDTF